MECVVLHVSSVVVTVAAVGVRWFLSLCCCDDVVSFGCVGMW